MPPKGAAPVRGPGRGRASGKAAPKTPSKVVKPKKVNRSVPGLTDIKKAKIRKKVKKELK